jgi:molecular chaperone GrpE (heat shock protein)
MDEEAEEEETEEAEEEEADEGDAKEAEVVSDEEAEEGADNETAEEKEVDPVVLGLKKELREAQEKITELEIFSNKVSKAYQQLKTDSDGAKDRMETQLKVRTDMEKGRVVGTMFEPIENLNRMLATLSDDDPNRGGVTSILGQFKTALDSLGLEEIRDEGKPFDPNRHEAMAMNNVDDKKLDGCIVQVFESGYAVGSKLIRPARVIVGKYVEPPKEESEDEKEGEGEEDGEEDAAADE